MLDVLTDLEWCRFCGVHTSLYPSRFRNICQPCLTNYERREPWTLHFDLCPRCNRGGWVFCCGWCSMKVCESCVYKEHGGDECHDPDDL